MEALLIIDVQNDFCKDGALEVKEGETIIPAINKLMDSFNLVVATQDSHPKGHKSFASTHSLNVGEIIKLGEINQFLWPDHCVKESKGEEFYPTLEIKKIDKIFKKGENIEVDSYSGFFDNDKKSQTGLDNFLKEKNVTSLTVVGLALDYCVKFTAIDAKSLGYDVTVISSMTKAVNISPNDGLKSIEEMKNLGIKIKD